MLYNPNSVKSRKLVHKFSSRVGSHIQTQTLTQEAIGYGSFRRKVWKFV